MSERRAGQIGVEQGNHAADAGDTQPDRQYSGRFGMNRQTDVAFARPCRAPIAHIDSSARRAPDRSSIAVGEQGRRVANCAASSSITVGKMRSGLRAMGAVSSSARSQALAAESAMAR